MSSDSRQEFVRAAVSFLQNPKLVDSSLKDKLKFLRDKGLTELEVDEALNSALVYRHQSQHGKWNYLIILGLCLGGYKLYQAYLESRENFRAQQKIAEQQQEEEKESKRREQEKIQHEQDSPTIAEILVKLAELKKLVEHQRRSSASEIQSLKTLLVGHEKFAAPPVIPAWQLKEEKVGPVESNNGVNGTQLIAPSPV